MQLTEIGNEPYMIKTYRQRRSDFRKSFKDTEAEFASLISDFSCAIYAGTPKILQQGRMYITTEFVCFYSRILTFEQKIFIAFKDISEVSKEKTAMVFPNAIQITKLNSDKYFFSSFTTRDKTYQVIYKQFREYKDGFKISKAAFWDRVRENYGGDLGFVLDDPEFDESNATQYTARYSPRKPSELIANSSPDDSIYESIDELSTSDSATDHSKCNGFVSKSSKLERKSSSVVNDSEEEIKFDLYVPSTPEEEEIKDLPKDDEAIPESVNIVLPPAQCTGHEHFPNILMDEEFNINVTLLWTYIFTDHAFYRALCAMRLTTDIIQSNWPEENDSNKESCRTIQYTVNLKNKIGPKKSPTIEKQVI